MFRVFEALQVAVAILVSQDALFQGRSKQAAINEDPGIP